MAVFFSSPFGRERAQWRLHFLVVGPSTFGGLSGSRESSGPDGTVAATAPIPVCSEQLPASFLSYASSDKIRSGALRDQTAGKIGLDLYVRIISKPAVL
jgi:hypothetical protein